MDTRFRTTLLFSITTIFLACSVQPKEIDYGKESCHYCDMTIMNDRYASELVTVKGKVFKFDAIECMIRYTNTMADQQYSFELIADYSSRGSLVNARASTFLVSENLPSPMGAFLSGFSSLEKARSMAAEYGGELYDWDQIQKYIVNN
jgi:copper chaperone NosL